jgi:hypothetical protein
MRGLACYHSIGDFHPEAHVKGFPGFNLIAFICKKVRLFFGSIFIKIILQMYKVLLTTNHFFDK